MDAEQDIAVAAANAAAVSTQFRPGQLTPYHEPSRATAEASALAAAAEAQAISAMEKTIEMRQDISRRMKEMEQALHLQIADEVKAKQEWREAQLRSHRLSSAATKLVTAEGFVRAEILLLGNILGSGEGVDEPMTEELRTLFQSI